MHELSEKDVMTVLDMIRKNSMSTKNGHILWAIRWAAPGPFIRA